jgi:hypothetical protein
MGLLRRKASMLTESWSSKAQMIENSLIVSPAKFFGPLKLDVFPSL